MSADEEKICKEFGQRERFGEKIGDLLCAGYEARHNIAAQDLLREEAEHVYRCASI